MSSRTFASGRLMGWLAVPLTLAVALAFVACSKSSTKEPTTPDTPTAPVPNSPQNVIALLKWSWAQRDTAAYRQVFSDDYHFSFAVSDSNDIGLDRSQELAVGNHLFRTGSFTNPAATSISFAVDNTLNVVNDDRPGKDPAVHKKITTSLRIVALTPGPDYSLLGTSSFYVVRGDSAAIPPDLGVGHDAARWYIERWQDDTVCLENVRVGGSDRALEACLTVGKLKLDYLAGPAPIAARH